MAVRRAELQHHDRNQPADHHAMRADQRVQLTRGLAVHDPVVNPCDVLGVAAYSPASRVQRPGSRVHGLWTLDAGLWTLDYLSSLNACVHECSRNPGMHHNMQSGSMARAAVAVPMSQPSHPNWLMIVATACLADALFPQ